MKELVHRGFRIQVFERNFPGLFRMMIIIRLNSFNGFFSFFYIVYGKQTFPYWKMRTESRVLQNHGTTAGQVSSTFVAEPSRICCNEYIFAYTEFTTAHTDIVLK